MRKNLGSGFESMNEAKVSKVVQSQVHAAKCSVEPGGVSVSEIQPYKCHLVGRVLSRTFKSVIR